MDFSVIILTFNSQRYIRTCLESLIQAFSTLEKQYEIFVIDNGSIDQSKTIVNAVRSEYQANIDLIALDRNTGTTFSRNIGLRKASGNNIIIMDSDAYANPQTIAAMANHLEQHPRCGMAVPRLTYPDGRFQISTDIFPTLSRKFQRMFFLKNMERETVVPTNGVHIVDYAISAFWMFPKKVLEQVGLLDEKIFYAPEDVDYCLRIWKAGYNIAYLPQYTLVHDAQELSRGFKINKFTLLHIKGLLYYFLKHRYGWGLNRLYQQLGRQDG